MSVRAHALCDQCRCEIDADGTAEVTCDSCWTTAQETIDELKTENAELRAERDELEEKLLVEAEVYASEVAKLRERLALLERLAG
jgi:hypothetical protein